MKKVLWKMSKDEKDFYGVFCIIEGALASFVLIGSNSS